MSRYIESSDAKTQNRVDNQVMINSYGLDLPAYSGPPVIRNIDIKNNSNYLTADVSLKFNDLLLDPQNYHPLSSVKSIKNAPTGLGIDLYKLFHCESNTRMIAQNLYRVSQNNSDGRPIEFFNKIVPKMMKIFSKNHNLYEFRMAEEAETGNINWVETIKAINYDFMKEVYNTFRWNNYNPFRDTYLDVGASDSRRKVKASDLMPDDYGTIDVYGVTDINRENKNFRYNNTIPFWQRTMNIRHFDRTNEGLRNGDPDEASLENFNRSFDMTNVNQTLNNWQRTGWFGL